VPLTWSRLTWSRSRRQSTSVELERLQDRNAFHSEGPRIEVTDMATFWQHSDPLMHMPEVLAAVKPPCPPARKVRASSARMTRRSPPSANRRHNERGRISSVRVEPTSSRTQKADERVRPNRPGMLAPAHRPKFSQQAARSPEGGVMFLGSYTRWTACAETRTLLHPDRRGGTPDRECGRGGAFGRTRDRPRSGVLQRVRPADSPGRAGWGDTSAALAT
jgi:hypothetical protein